MNCPLCQAPQRGIWPPTNSSPDLMVFYSSGWNCLLKCPRCNRLWEKDCHEPYGSFVYYIWWDDTAERWHEMRANLDSWRNWSKEMFVRYESSLTYQDWRSIQWHFIRNYGKTPYSLETICQKLGMSKEEFWKDAEKINNEIQQKLKKSQNHK